MPEDTPPDEPSPQSAAPAPRLVVDHMLGRLAKWLRLLGYDTVYSGNLDDADLARIALAEDRILLTRDAQLARRRRLRTILVQSDHPPEQLSQVARELHLSAGNPLSRCLRCNSVLHYVDKNAVQGEVPPYIWETQEYFSRCPDCGRLYWRGTHWERMQRMLQRFEGEQSP